MKWRFNGIFIVILEHKQDIAIKGGKQTNDLKNVMPLSWNSALNWSCHRFFHMERAFLLFMGVDNRNREEKLNYLKTSKIF